MPIEVKFVPTALRQYPKSLILDLKNYHRVIVASFAILYKHLHLTQTKMVIKLVFSALIAMLLRYPKMKAAVCAFSSYRHKFGIKGRIHALIALTMIRATFKTRLRLQEVMQIRRTMTHKNFKSMTTLSILICHPTFTSAAFVSTFSSIRIMVATVFVPIVRQKAPMSLKIVLDVIKEGTSISIRVTDVFNA